MFCYQEVIEIDTLSQNELYARAKSWIANAYRSANDVIQLDDPEKGIIIAKGFTKNYWNTNDLDIYHTLTIEIKEGRYRYTFSDFVMHFPLFRNSVASFPASEKPMEDGRGMIGYKKVLERSDKELRLLIENLKSAMTRSSLVGGSDW
ncbi:MAG: DUF4468 domain-containing protein [bacterium]|jgi:hypothetical protein|nr:DUF4468 domain-containing protein [bacterium]